VAEETDVDEVTAFTEYYKLKFIRADVGDFADVTDALTGEVTNPKVSDGVIDIHEFNSIMAKDSMEDRDYEGL
jgi:hypothetical protein